MEQINQLNKFILFIIGTTAAGKTKLSLSLGQKFQGEVVSCDSMQIYKKVNIMTAKATEQEQQLVKHYLVDKLELNEKSFNRNKFYHMAQDCITQINAKNKFPILVGGTHYYLESLLFKQNISEIEEDSQNSDNNAYENDKSDSESINNDHNIQTDNKDKEESAKIQLSEVQQQLLPLSKEELYEKLKTLDPLMANKIHPNDQRKVVQYLTKALTQSKLPSQTYQNYDNIPLRNENCLIFWPRCTNIENLKQQQKKRINEMVYSKGVDEIIQIFSEIVGDNYDDVNCLTGGVMQSIGYKEFLPLYKYYKKEFKASESKQLPDDIVSYLKKTSQGEQILNQCIDRLVINTYKYTKRQIRWIKYKIMMNQNGEQIKNRLFVFDFTEFSGEHFKQRVIDPANYILQKYFEIKEKLKDDQSGNQIIQTLVQDKEVAKYLIRTSELKQAQQKHINKGLDQWKNFNCEVCNKFIHGQNEYQAHMKSHGHKRMQKLAEKKKKRLLKQQMENKIQTQNAENNNQQEDGSKQKN